MSETMTAEVVTLLEIMNDPDVPTRRRIQCAEYLLSHQSPDEAVNCAHEYLGTVFQNREEELEHRMDAIGVSRKYATARVTTPSIVQLREHKNFIEVSRKDAIERRREILILKGVDPWDFPKDWCSDLEAPDWLPYTPE